MSVNYPRPISESPANVAAPKYDRAALTAGILHFGVGNFHRSHQAVYLDDCSIPASAMTGRLVGAGVFEGEKVGREKLEEQDWLTTVVEQDSGHRQARVTGAMIDFLMPGDAGRHHRTTRRSFDKDRLADHHRGWLFHRSGVRKIQPGAIPTSSPMPQIAAPKTVFGLILAGLMRRRDEGGVPFTVMSCDNIPHNGHVTSDGVVGLALLIDEDLAELGQRACRLSERHGRPHHACHKRARARHSFKRIRSRR